MANVQVNPTRMELTRLKKKLVTAMRGHKLLKDKRDELMRQFLDLVRENKALREKVEEGIRAANKNFVIARAAMEDEAINVGRNRQTRFRRTTLSLPTAWPFRPRQKNRPKSLRARYITR